LQLHLGNSSQLAATGPHEEWNNHKGDGKKPERTDQGKFLLLAHAAPLANRR